jgi:hypothetical protein
MERPVATVGSMGSVPEAVRCGNGDGWGWWVDWVEWGVVGREVISDIEARSG